MNSKTKNNTDEVSVETLGLLSWYAADLLSSDERATIDKLLKKHPELNQYLNEEKQIIEQFTQDKSLLDLSALEPSKTRLKNVMERLDKTATSANVDTSQNSTTQRPDSLWTKVVGFIHSLSKGEASTLKYASFASITIFVALLVAFIAPLIEKQSDSAFHPATEKSADARNQVSVTELLIGINGDTQNAWLQDFLHKNTASISQVPGKDGLYRVKFDKKLDKEEVESLLKQFNSNKEVIWFAGEAY